MYGIRNCEIAYAQFIFWYVSCIVRNLAGVKVEPAMHIQVFNTFSLESLANKLSINLRQVVSYITTVTTPKIINTESVVSF